MSNGVAPDARRGEKKLARVTNDPALTPVHDDAELSRITERRTARTITPRIESDDGKEPPTPVEKYVTGRARGFKDRIKRFTPSWFSVVMGTGICNTLLFYLPWESTHPAFAGIGAGFLALAILICLLFSGITIARYSIWPAIVPVLLANETHSLFLGCIPMAYVTIVSGIGFVGNYYSIPHAVEVAAGLFWIPFAMSLVSATVVPLAMFTKHHATPEGLSALWLLPVVPCITIGATGATLAGLLIPINPHYALTILLVSYVMNGIGLLLAIFIMVLYLQRLAIHHLPQREIIVSSLLPLGPCGQGGFALVRAGQTAQELFPVLAAAYPDRDAYVALQTIGPALHGAGIMMGLLLWGLGIWWAFIAWASIATVFLEGWHLSIGSFSMGFWSSTFPIGSLALLTLILGSTFDSLFFNVVATIMTVIVLTMWALCFYPTAVGFMSGTLFAAPCLTKLDSGTATPATVREQSQERVIKEEAPAAG